MPDTIRFFTHPMSRGRIVRWMLEEVGTPYDAEILGFGSTMKDEAYRAINPMGKVPAIVHDGRVVTETAAICAYLADVFPQAGLAPTAADRADYYRWMFFAAGPMEAATSNKALGFEVPKDRERMIGYGRVDDVLTALEQAVGAHPYIAGNSFSAADVYVGSQIGWGLQFGTIEKRPAFIDYFRRLAERPAYRRATELDDTLAARMQAAS